MSDTLRLEGRVALVTGAAQGIGAEIAGLLVQRGATVILADIDTTVQQTARALGDAASHVSLDVSDQDRRSRTVALTRAGKALVAEARPLWAGAQRRFERTFGTAAALDLRTVLKQLATTEFG